METEFELNTSQVPGKHTPAYYEKYGQAHDDILRCEGCRRLVTYVDITKHGSCPRCGHRRMCEIQSLTLPEWLRIRLGLLSFPHREEFLKEFSRGK